MKKQRRIVAYLDGLQAKVNALRELQPIGQLVKLVSQVSALVNTE